MKRTSQLLCSARTWPRTRRWRVALVLGSLLATAVPAANAAQPLGPDSAGAIGDSWQTVQLDQDVAPTRYRIRQWDGRLAIEAHADNSMTLLARRAEINLDETPVLCWHWRVDAPLKTADLRRKSGDDYAARVYVAYAVDPDDLGFTTRAKLKLARLIYGDEVPDAAINYIWDNDHPVGTLADNAYTDRTRMYVLQTGAQQAGQWVAERRNLLADFRQAFGHAPARVTLLSVASDTDNTGETAHAGFSGFTLVGAEEPCPC